MVPAVLDHRQAPHDAHDDAAVLAAILARLVHTASEANVTLPICPVPALYQHAARAAA